MRKNILKTLVVLLVSSFSVIYFTGCEKDQTPPTPGGVTVYEGVFKPQKKIKSVTTMVSDEEFRTEYQWTGDLLTEEIHKLDGTITSRATYTYNEHNQLTQANDGDDVYKYYYNAQHLLDSIVIGSATVPDEVARVTKRDANGKIVRIDVRYLDPVDQADNYYVEYAWVNSNISLISEYLTLGDKLEQTTLCLTDDKKNPFYGLLREESIRNFDPNNVVSEVETEGGNTWTITNSYTYDADGYPTHIQHKEGTIEANIVVEYYE